MPNLTEPNETNGETPPSFHPKENPHSASAIAVRLAVLSASLALAVTLPAATVTLAWDPSPSEDIGSYKVYYGKTPGNYTQVIPVGNTNRATVIGLTAGTRYYFAATAVARTGLESTFSVEISHLLPTATQPVLTVHMTPAKQAILIIYGPAGYSYEVEASEEFGQWHVLRTVTIGSNGSARYLDVRASSYPSRFYRLREVSRVPPVTQPSLSVALNPQKQAILTVTGPADLAYEVEASQTLDKWLPLGTVTIGSNGSAQFTDAYAPAYPKRFYRLRQVSPVEEPKLTVQVTPEVGTVLTINGPVGYTYDVQASQSLGKWLTLETVTLGPDGEAQYIDFTASTYSTRFYRIVQSSP